MVAQGHAGLLLHSARIEGCHTLADSHVGGALALADVAKERQELSELGGRGTFNGGDGIAFFDLALFGGHSGRRSAVGSVGGEVSLGGRYMVAEQLCGFVV